ncbi:MAG: BTAD domain-containing putative transcriptional regulator [Gemmatimonadota bacterium]
MLELRTLGAIDLRAHDGRDVRSILKGPKRLALLAYLALRMSHGFQRRDAIVGLLWPELNQERARHALRNTLHSLRSALADGAVVNRGDEEVGIARGRLWCDAVAFEEALERGDGFRAAELYRGELLPAFFLADAPDFERWLEAERRRLRARAVDAAWSAARACEAADDVSDAKRYGRRAVGLDPADEVSVRRLIALLDRLGDRLGAVHAYQEFALRFKAEYGLRPSPETRELIGVVSSRDEAESAASSHRVEASTL